MEQARRRSVTAMLALAVFAVPLGLAVPASASPVTGCRFTESSVGVQVAGDVGTWHVGRALQIWNGVHAGQPHLYLTTRPTAPVKVRRYWSSGTAVDAWTSYRCGDQQPTTATIYVNAARRLSDASRATVSVHELGHALGLGHRPLAVQRSVMFPRLWGMTDYPTRLDRRTLASVYS